MKKEIPMMKCGHAANAKDSEGKPCCVICGGIDSHTIDDNPPSLEGRISMCVSCERLQPSSTDLPFFECRIDQRYDNHYDGCRGWD